MMDTLIFFFVTLHSKTIKLEHHGQKIETNP